MYRNPKHSNNHVHEVEVTCLNLPLGKILGQTINKKRKSKHL